MTITYEEIANRAFQIWKREGEPEGHEQEHWFKAEAELRKERSKGKRPEARISKTLSGRQAERD